MLKKTAIITAGLWAISRAAPRATSRNLLAASRRLLGLTLREVRVEGLRVVYLEKGEGEPLILLHGIGADRRHFIRVAPALAKRFRLIIIDLPGFGDSDRPQDVRYTIDAQVRRLHAFTRALGLERFALAGNSMGGFIAGAYAIEHPEAVTCLWLLAPAGVLDAEPSELLQARARGEKPLIFARSLSEMREVVRFATHRPPFIPNFLLQALAEVQAARHAHHERVLEDLDASGGLDERLRERPCSVPTLIVWGARDRVLHVSGADILARLIPHARVQRLEDVGHLPQIEAPREIVARFFAFHAANVTP